MRTCKWTNWTAYIPLKTTRHSKVFRPMHTYYLIQWNYSSTNEIWLSLSLYLRCTHRRDVFAIMTVLLATYYKNISLKFYYSVISSFLLWFPFSSKPIIILLPLFIYNLLTLMRTRDASIRLRWCRWNWWTTASRQKRISISYKQVGKHSQKWILIIIHDW